MNQADEARLAELANRGGDEEFEAVEDEVPEWSKGYSAGWVDGLDAGRQESAAEIERLKLYDLAGYIEVCAGQLKRIAELEAKLAALAPKEHLTVQVGRCLKCGEMISNSEGMDVLRENERLIEQLRIAREALNHYASATYYDGWHNTVDGEPAKRALSAIEKYAKDDIPGET